MDNDSIERPKDRLVGQILVAGICLIICIILLACRVVRDNFG